MTDNSSERALLAILALEPDENVPLGNDERALGNEPLPTLDARVEMFTRAMRDSESGGEYPADARELILAAMAKDLAKRSERSSEHGSSALRPLNRDRRPSRSGIGTSAYRALRRTSVFVASAAALLMVGWSGAWLFALHSLNTTVAEWREWEGKSGRKYSCASEGFGGSPLRVELLCGGVKAAIATENATFTAEAREVRLAVDLFHPSVIVSKLEGPVSFAELGRPGSFTGRWSHAEATLTGPKSTPDGLSVELADFTLARVANDGTKPLVSAEHVAFRARLDPIATAATKKAAYDLTSDITAGSLPSGPPLVVRPFEARMNAVLHGVGDMTPKPLPERIKGWQHHGGLVEMTSIEIRGSAVDANAQGTIALSEHGGIEGLLELSGEQYDQLFKALTGDAPASGPAGPAAPGAADRAHRKLPALRFVDGAAYFGSTSLGRLPALF